MDKKKLITQINGELNYQMEQLESLETKKQKIIKMYKNAKPDEKVLLEAKMKQCEEKYKHLYSEVLHISKQVKKLNES